MPGIKDVLCKLSRLNEALDKINKGDHPYHQFYFFRNLNGDDCKLLAPLSMRIDLQSLDKEIDEFVQTYTEYKQQQQQR